jgi:hypothetical protein
MQFASEEAKARAEARIALDIDGWSISENDDVLGSVSVPIKATRHRPVGRFTPRGGTGAGNGGRGGGKAPAQRVRFRSAHRAMGLILCHQHPVFLINLRQICLVLLTRRSPLPCNFYLKHQATLGE